MEDNKLSLHISLGTQVRSGSGSLSGTPGGSGSGSLSGTPGRSGSSSLSGTPGRNWSGSSDISGGNWFISDETSLNNLEYKENEEYLIRHYAPQINKIITLLCNIGTCSDADILGALKGHKSLEGCGISINSISNSGVIKSNQEKRELLEFLQSKNNSLGPYNKIKKEVSRAICFILSDSPREYRSGDDAKNDYQQNDIVGTICKIYLLTLPPGATDQCESYIKTHFLQLKMEGLLPVFDIDSYNSKLIDKDDYVDMVKRDIRHLPQNNLVKNLAKVVKRNINKYFRVNADLVDSASENSSKYSHMLFNQMLGDNLVDVPNKNLVAYFEYFAKFLGISVATSTYLERNPITVLYDQKLTCIAVRDSANKLNSIFTNKANASINEKQPIDILQVSLKADDLRACGLDDLEEQMFKCGAITAVPGVFILHVRDCGENYSETDMHFGEMVNIIGIQNPHQDTDIYTYYKRLYFNVINKVVFEKKIDHLILNILDNNHFFNSSIEKAIHADALFDVLIKSKEHIREANIKITISDYAKTIECLPDIFENNDILKSIDFMYLTGEDADLQGSKLAYRVWGCTYIGLVSFSSAIQYGGDFLINEGKTNTEERIYNQLFFGLCYDAVVGFAEKDYELAHYIKITDVNDFS